MPPASCRVEAHFACSCETRPSTRSARICAAADESPSALHSLKLSLSASTEQSVGGLDDLDSQWDHWLEVSDSFGERLKHFTPKPQGPYRDPTVQLSGVVAQLDAVFISYRRNDAEKVAKRLYAGLASRMSSGLVYQDTANLQPGMRWPQALEEAVKTAGVLLAIIGKRWLDKERLADPEDWVRNEIRLAFASKVDVLPLLVSGASMPAKRDLPKDIQKLSEIQAFPLSRDWKKDVDGLVTFIRQRQGLSGSVLRNQMMMLKSTSGAIAQNLDTRRDLGP